jgi:hypothetical protein
MRLFRSQLASLLCLAAFTYPVYAPLLTGQPLTARVTLGPSSAPFIPEEEEQNHGQYKLELKSGGVIHSPRHGDRRLRHGWPQSRPHGRRHVPTHSVTVPPAPFRDAINSPLHC